MKASELKNILKEAIEESMPSIIKEVFNSEIKNIVLESIKGNNRVINEGVPVDDSQRLAFRENLRNQYMGAIQDTALSANTSNFSGTFKPNPNQDIDGALPSGEVDLTQIMNLIKK